LPIIVSDLSYGKQQIKTVKIILHRKLYADRFFVACEQKI